MCECAGLAAHALDGAAFSALGSPKHREHLISPGACCWDARPGQVRAWAALSFALFAFARAFLSVPLCLLPCCCSPPAPALRALGAEATSGLAPPAADTRKP